MLSKPAILAINHLLAAESWAREALMPHAGKSARLSVPPFDVDLTVLPDGLIDEAAEPPETRIKASPLALARAAGGSVPEVELSGDIEFARAISLLFNHLKWDFEEDLGRVAGDVIAHRIAGAAEALISWQKATGWRIAANFAEYWTEERPLIAARADVEAYNDAVDSIRDDVERLEKRLEKLVNH